MNPDSITTNPELVAYCGLYCGACKAYRSGRCPGCRKNEKAGWCKVRACCISTGRSTCADCTTHPDPRQCGIHNNFISRLFGFVFRSNRAACVDRIRAIGREGFAGEMAKAGRHSLPR
jgi:hypothetical protein